MMRRPRLSRCADADSASGIFLLSASCLGAGLLCPGAHAAVAEVGGAPFTLRSPRRVGTAVRTGPISGAGHGVLGQRGAQRPMPALECKARKPQITVRTNLAWRFNFQVNGRWLAVLRRARSPPPFRRPKLLSSFSLPSLFFSPSTPKYHSSFRTFTPALFPLLEYTPCPVFHISLLPSFVLFFSFFFVAVYLLFFFLSTFSGSQPFIDQRPGQWFEA